MTDILLMFISSLCLGLAVHLALGSVRRASGWRVIRPARPSLPPGWDEMDEDERLEWQDGTNAG